MRTPGSKNRLTVSAHATPIQPASCTRYPKATTHHDIDDKWNRPPSNPATSGMASIATNRKQITILSHRLVSGCTRLRTTNISGFARVKEAVVAAISRVKTSRKGHPRVHGGRPGG